MHFKKMALLLLTVSIFAGCSNESIPSHQKSIPEEDIRPIDIQQSEYQEVSTSNRYNENHEKILNLLSSPTEANLASAFSLLKKHLLGENLENKEVYIQPTYGGFLELFVKTYFLSKKLNSDEGKILSETMRFTFYESYIKSCIEGQSLECELMANGISQEKTTADLIFDIGKYTEDPFGRLDILGAAFDIKSLRENQALENLYTDTALEALAEVESGSKRLDKIDIQKHLRNLLTLNSNLDWGSATFSMVKRYKTIKP